MGQAKRKREVREVLEKAATTVDLAPLTNPEVRAAVLALMVRKGLVRA